ncbi:glycosyltransferase family 52 protein [Gammaproteobacteria bacterium]|jgi:hypothetical protein|nr:glycosyltransferase family 52 protein [Gammaproteobacteria bacterium]
MNHNLEKLLDEGHKHQSLCYVDSLIHARKVLQIQERYLLDIVFITNNLNVKKFLQLNNCQYYYYHNTLKLLSTIKHLRGIHFYLFIAACVDQVGFQIIYFLSKTSFFATMDEGIFSIDPLSRFNSEKNFNPKTHKPFFILNRIFNYPKIPSFFLEKSDLHFAWFSKNLYLGTNLEKKLVPMESPDHLAIGRTLRVLVGQPYKWMGLSEKNELEILNIIKQEKIDIYIKHPRETSKNSIIPNIECTVLSLDSNVEDFLNNLPVPDLHIYTFMSSAVFGLRSEVNIHILDLMLSKEIQERFKNFIKMLDESIIEYNKT